MPVETEGVELAPDESPEKSELYTTCCCSGDSIDRLEADELPVCGCMLELVVARLEVDADGGVVRPGCESKYNGP